MFRCTASAACVLLVGALGVAGAAQERRVEQTPEQDSAQALFLLGHTKEQARDLVGAAAAYERALQRSPNLPAAHDRLGYVRGQLGQTDAALEHFARAVELQPGFFDAQYHLGATRWWTRDIDGARAPLEAAVGSVPTMRRRATTWASFSDNKARSRKRSNSSANQSPCRRASPPRTCSSVSRFSNGAIIDDAVAHLKTAVDIDPSSIDARNSLGLALMQSGRADAAIETLRQLVRDHPDDNTARLNLGTTLLQKADLSGAIAVFTELLKRDPSNALAQYNLGVAHKQQDDFERAEAALRRATALPARRRRRPSRSASCCGRQAAAPKRRRVSRGLARRPEIRRRALHAGHGAEQQGAIDEALAAAPRAVESAPTSSKHIEPRATAQRRRGDEAGARRAGRGRPLTRGKPTRRPPPLRSASEPQS